MKIALVRLSSLGDIIKAASVIQNIKKNINCEITFIADSRFADILDNTKNLDYLIKLPLKDLKHNFSFNSLKYTLSLLPHKKFDIVIDLHGMLKAAIISKYISKKKVFGFDKIIKEPLSKLFYDKSFAFECYDNEVYRFNKLVSLSLGYNYEYDNIFNIEPFLKFKIKDYSYLDNYIDFAKNLLVIGSSHGWKAKKYPISKWIELIKKSNEKFLICWGNNIEKEEAMYISNNCNNVKILPKINLNDLKYVISKMNLVIGNDTGPTHIAWAMGIKSIILFGCSDINATVENEKVIALKSKSKVNHCKFNKNDFSIKEISTDEILNAMRKLL